MPLFSRSKTLAPITVSLTSLGADGKQNNGFEVGPADPNGTIDHNGSNGIVQTPRTNGDACGNEQVSNRSTNRNNISIIADNSILTHRLKTDIGSSNEATTNGGAHSLHGQDAEAANGTGASTQAGAKTTSTATPSTQQPEQNGVEMKKSITLVHMVAILVSVTGHSSIFIAPATILTQAGSVGVALVVWLVGGIIHLGQALCFAELGTMYPGAGGPYAYAMIAFGPLVGFLMMWGITTLIAGPFWAFLARTAAVYIFKSVFTDCTSPQVETATTLLGGWIIVTLVFLNCVYMKYVTKVQTLLSSCKLIVLLIIITIGIYYIAKGENEHLQAPFENTATEPGQLALAIFYATFAYGGWPVMTIMLAEVKDPTRDPPRASYISFAIVISLYVLANMSYLALLSPAQVMTSTALASDFIAEISDVLAIVVSVLVALSSIGALNALIMGHSRLLFAGARNGHMPCILGMVHAKYITPWPSIFVYTAWALAMLFTGGVVDMMDFISLFATIMGLVVVTALLYVRYTKPDVHRPYKTMLVVPILEFVINLAILVLAIYQKPQKMGIGLAILFAGIPVYWFGVTWKKKPKEFTGIVDKLTLIGQKLFLLTKVNT